MAEDVKIDPDGKGFVLTVKLAEGEVSLDKDGKADPCDVARQAIKKIRQQVQIERGARNADDMITKAEAAKTGDRLTINAP
jgi:hypothetical protein